MDRLGPYELGPGGENEGIYTGDARILSKAIPDESVDLIFSDPIYQNIDDYQWLAKVGARVLKARGNLLVYVTQEHLPHQINAMMSYLRWGWLFGIQLFGRRAAMWRKKIQACGQLMAWLARSETFTHDDWVSDFIGTNARQKNGHEWRKGLEETTHYLAGFTGIDGVVLDPFTGGGTVPTVCKMLNRRYLAFEIESDIAELARARVRMTRPPLPGLALEMQAVLGLGKLDEEDK